MFPRVPARMYPVADTGLKDYGELKIIVADRYMDIFIETNYTFDLFGNVKINGNVNAVTVESLIFTVHLVLIYL